MSAELAVTIIFAVLIIGGLVALYPPGPKEREKRR